MAEIKGDNSKGMTHACICSKCNKPCSIDETLISMEEEEIMNKEGIAGGVVMVLMGRYCNQYHVPYDDNIAGELIVHTTYALDSYASHVLAEYKKGLKEKMNKFTKREGYYVEDIEVRDVFNLLDNDTFND